MTMLKAKSLSPAAVDALGQLFTKGPTWDGNLISKEGRSELVEAGLAQQQDGWTFLTAYGVRVAVEWDRAILREWHNKSWYEKASCR